MVGWYLALAASQQSSVRLLQFAPKFTPLALECLDANHSFASRLGLQTAAYSSFPCAGTIGTYCHYEVTVPCREHTSAEMKTRKLTQISTRKWHSISYHPYSTIQLALRSYSRCRCRCRCRANSYIKLGESRQHVTEPHI